MRLLHHAFATSYPAFNLLRKLKYFTGYDRSICLRVLLYHDIAPQEHVYFERQLGWFGCLAIGHSSVLNNLLLL